MEREDYLHDINTRIVRVTEDLRAIQRELNCAAMQAPTDPELMEALSQLPEMESLRVLKSALDQMRHFLWFYIQVMTNESEAGDRLRQSIRQKPAGTPCWGQRRLCWKSSNAQPTRHFCGFYRMQKIGNPTRRAYSNITDFTRLRGRSTSSPFCTVM